MERYSLDCSEMGSDGVASVRVSFTLHRVLVVSIVNAFLIHGVSETVSAIIFIRCDLYRSSCPGITEYHITTALILFMEYDCCPTREGIKNYTYRLVHRMNCLPAYGE